MANIPGTVRVAGKIAPTDSMDTYPTHDSIYGKGGYVEVADITARDAITTERRSEGMMVFVIATQDTYQLVGGITNANWQLFVAGGGMLSGSGSPNGVVTGVFGQSYLDTNTNSIYRCISDPSGTAWVQVGGVPMLSGTGNPNGVVSGAFGQSYFDTAAQVVYKCVADPSGDVWLVI